MASLTLSEMVAIVLVILIVFGPQRLPEMARRAALSIRRLRTIAASVREEFEAECGEIAAPLREVREEVVGARQDLIASVSSITEEIRRAQTHADEAATAQMVPSADLSCAADDVEPDELTAT